MIHLPHIAVSQLCEPVFKVEKQIIGSSSTRQMTNGDYNTIATIGQPLAAMSSTNYTDNSVAMGFWSYYLQEPRPPIVLASDGDYQNMIYLEWIIEGDYSGPPVTGDNITIYRDGLTLETLPATHSEYQDFNVFPGEYYSYGVSTYNDFGESHTDDNVGFLNPNGVITGHVETPSGNSVQSTKISLSPNMGRSLSFNGNDYVYFMGDEHDTYRQFNGLEGDYTVELWFRSTATERQTIFSAVDSASTVSRILLELTDTGSIRWYHSPGSGQNSSEIVSVSSYTQSGEGADWHHLAVIFENNQMIMFCDGSIIGENTASGPINEQVEIILGKKNPREPEFYFQGYMDDVRLWSIARTWDDIRNHADLTLSGNESNLIAYWKFDEINGEIAFDLTANSFDALSCGAVRADFTAPVFLGALTDTNGFFSIQNIYYENGTTFTVTPSQETPIDRALEFDGIDDYVSFENQRIDITSDFTIEGWFKTGSEAEQIIVAGLNPANGSTQFSISMTSAGAIQVTHLEIILTAGSEFDDFLWHHFAVTCGNGQLTLYVDVTETGSEACSASISDLLEPVISDNLNGQAFDGLLDEFRIWNVLRTQAEISGTMQQILEGDEEDLLHYWRMNEGFGELLSDLAGAICTGELHGPVYTKDIPVDEIFIHAFEPESRNATLNQSNTSVDNIDFTDISMIPITGYVRFEDTPCFEEDVEILLNGLPLSPQVMTDADGKFTLEIAPGRSGDVISCQLPGHSFSPEFIQLPLISTPLSGQNFSDDTKNNLSGSVSGGSCGFPINPSSGEIQIIVEAVCGCIADTLTTDENGGFSFPDLPAINYIVQVDHPDSTIDASFLGQNVSLVGGDCTINFVYHAPLEVSIGSSADINDCGFRTMDAGFEYGFTADVFESYYDYQADGSIDTNRCDYTGTLDITVYDNLTEPNQTETLQEISNPAEVFYTTRPLEPNMLDGGDHPYQKNISIMVEDETGRTAADEAWVYVLGPKIVGETFVTTAPEWPELVLFDPPGDHSYSYFLQDSTYSVETGLCTVDVFDTTQTQEINYGIAAGFELPIIGGVGFDIEYIDENNHYYHYCPNIS